MYIYKIINHTNGKVYVGQTIGNPQKRWREHLWALRKDDERGNLHLRNAWKKYGKDSFSFVVIISIPTCSHQTLDLMEKLVILANNSSFGKGTYNKTLGGNSGRWTEETKANFVSKMIGVNAPMYGRKHSAETKALIGASSKGRNIGRKLKPMTDENKLKQSLRHKGKKISDSHKEAIRKWSTGRKHTAESLAKMSRSQLGHKRNVGSKRSEETKAKMKLARNKRPPMTEDTRARIVVAQRKRREQEKLSVKS